jgi:hypothetical protein
MKRKTNKSSKPQFHTEFHVKDGSNLKEVNPSSKDWSGNNTCYFYTIAREEIEACDTTRLLHDLRPEADNPLLKAGPGSVLFSVTGYDEDPRELLTIPEVHSYFRKVQQKAPCWLYFEMPGYGWLNVILAMSTPGCQTVEWDGTISAAQVTKFMEPQIKEYTRLCKLVGTDRDVMDYHLYEVVKASFPGIGMQAAPTMD